MEGKGKGKGKGKGNGKEKAAEVLAMLEEGVQRVLDSERFREWLQVQARFHDYSFGNCILIWLQRPNATRVAGYKTWQALGRQVRRGEKGIRILAPILRRAPVKEQPDELQNAGLPESHDGPEAQDRRNGDHQATREVLVGFRVVTVFDIAQTEGRPLPTLAERIATSSDAGRVMLEALRAAASRLGLRLEEGDCRGANGWYQHATRTVRLQAGLATDQAAKTLAHELGHAVLHGARPAEGEEPVSREQEETEAEAVAFVVATRFGLDTSGYSFDYIAAWARGARAVLRSGERIRKAAAAILRAAGVDKEGGAEEALKAG